jgi:Na+-transporting NADH:ubiquinone oxidoreductase subunit NqrE
LSIVYLVLVNALTQVAGAAVWREYNPGLWSAVGLFLPVGMLAVLETSRQPGVRHLHHAVGLGAAIAIHVVIVAYTKLRAARLRAAS